MPGNAGPGPDAASAASLAADIEGRLPERAARLLAAYRARGPVSRRPAPGGLSRPAR